MEPWGWWGSAYQASAGLLHCLLSSTKMSRHVIHALYYNYALANGRNAIDGAKFLSEP